MKHKIKVVTLPKLLDNGQERHLYIAASEPIKEGDYWIYICPIDGVDYGDNNKAIVKNSLPSSWFDKLHDKNNYFKIIATTDPKLTVKEVKTFKDVSPATNIATFDTAIIYKPIPQVPQAFLKEFVANPDGEFEVEYEVNTVTKGTSGFDFYEEDVIELKLNQANEVNITSVDNSLKQQLIEHLESNHIEASENRVTVIMNFIKSITSVDKKVYSSKELIDILDEFNNGETEADPFRNGEEFDNWIKENL
jgi:hypothetical protein